MAAEAAALAAARNATGFNAVFAAAVARGLVNATLLEENEGVTRVLVVLPKLPIRLLGEPETVSLTIPAAATRRGHRPIVCNPQLVLRPRRALVSGTLLGEGVDEERIRASDHELLLSVASDEFTDDVGHAGGSAATSELLASLAATSALGAGITRHHVERLSRTTVRLSIFASAHAASYDVDAPEVVSLVVPASCLRSNVSLAFPSFVLRALPGAAAWYPAYSSPTVRSVRVAELEIQQSDIDYETRIDLSIGTDAWVAELGSDNAATRAFLAGFLSLGSEATGWNRVVRPQLTHANVRRVNDHRVELVISGFAGFNIAEPETVRLTVPAEAVVSGGAIAAGGPDIVIVPTRGSASLSGTLLTSPFERTMQSVAGGELFFALDSDGFVPEIGQAEATSDDACTGTLIDQLTLQAGGTQQPLGWENVVQATLRAKLDTMLVRESRTTLRIQLPQLLVYKLSEAETITAAIPGACLVSGNTLQAQHVAGAPFRVLPAVGRAFLSGSLLTQAFEASVKSSSSKIVITVQDDSIVGTLSASALRAAVPSIITGSLGAAQGAWSSIVQAALDASAVPSARAPTASTSPSTSRRCLRTPSRSRRR